MMAYEGNENEMISDLYMHWIAEVHLCCRQNFNKIYYNLAKLWAKSKWALFSETVCIRISWLNELNKVETFTVVE